MMDQIVGENNFQNEIIWKRTTAHNDAQTRFSHVTDTILFYSNGGKHTWNPEYKPHKESYIKSHYNRKNIEGRAYRLDNIIRSQSMGPRPNLVYEYGGFTPEWGWRMVREKLEELEKQGRIEWIKNGNPYLIRFLDEQNGEILDNLWDDITPLNSQAKERIGYPTQKPLSLLERIIKASSNPGDLVLDAFCGCGTALVAAEQLDREWIGIDYSPTACRVMAQRLKKICKLREGNDFFVRDMPRNIKQLHAMPPFEFENWAVIALGGIPNKAQVGDMGIDGRIYPVSAVPKKGKDDDEYFADFMDAWYPIQVKQKDKAGRPDIDAFEAVMTRNDRSKGFFVSFGFSSDATREIGAFFKKSGRSIIALTVQEILDEEISTRLV
jgi:DNA modification methylase